MIFQQVSAIRPDNPAYASILVAAPEAMENAKTPDDIAQAAGFYDEYIGKILFIEGRHRKFFARCFSWIERLFFGPGGLFSAIKVF